MWPVMVRRCGEGWKGKQEALEDGVESHRGAVSRKVKECKLGFRKFPKYSGMETQSTAAQQRVSGPSSSPKGGQGSRELLGKMGSCRVPRPPPWLQVNRYSVALCFERSPPQGWQETRQVSSVGNERRARGGGTEWCWAQDRGSHRSDLE